MKDQTSVNQNADQTEHAPRITHHSSEIQHSNTPSIHSPTSLQLFTQPAILREIGPARLAKFLAGFSGELPLALAQILATLSDQPARDPLPPPEVAADDALNTFPVLAPPQQSGHRPHSAPLVGLADLLTSKPLLPERLRLTLLALEAAAAPDNQARLDDAIARRIPSVSLSPCCALDRALELWFRAPDEFSQFQTGPCNATKQKGNHSSPSSHPPIQESSNPSIHQSAPQLPSAACNASTLQPSNASTAQVCNDATMQPCNNSPVHTDTPPLPSFASAVDPWPQPVAARLLLDALRELLKRFVVLPRWAAETLALWILHTYAFELRDISTYIGIESPQRRCGKTTLLTILCQLVNRPVVAANVSSPSFFRAIEELRPTLMIDEADRFLKGKHELQGILNAGYSRKTAFVLRVGQPLPKPESKSQPSTLAFFSCWCPKLISQIGRLPDTLADRCIVIRMQRKTPHEECERLRNLDTMALRRQCARFVLDNTDAIANARPQIPARLNARAADIWEPLLALADLAGGQWPELARQAALSLSDSANENNLIGPLLLDIMLLFISSKADRMFTRDLLAGLNSRLHRPWAETLKGKQVTEQWLAQQLRPYGVKPRTLWLNGAQAKGYFSEEFTDISQRYISQSELDALKQESEEPPPSATNNGSGQAAAL